MGPACIRPAAGFRKQVEKMILITGASGSVGKTVLQEAIRQQSKVRAMYRSKEEAAKAPSGSHPEGAFAASSFDRYIARTLDCCRIASCKTVLPTLPLAPVIRIIFSTCFLKPAAGRIQAGSCEPNALKAWYNGPLSAVKYAQICKLGVLYEGPPWLSRSSGHQRPERQVESPGGLASFFRAAAFRRTPQSPAGRQRKSSRRAAP